MNIPININPYQLVTLSTADRPALETRIRGILGDTVRNTRRYVVALLLVTMAVVGPLAALRSQAQQGTTPAATAHDTTATAALGNAKQIALGMLMYVQDYDEHFPSQPATYQKQINPYLKNMALFTSPLDKPGTISFKMNPALAKKPLARIPEPARTVALYEGAVGKPLFRYDGNTTAVIGFVDGHAKLVTRAEAAKAIWKPAFTHPSGKAHTYQGRYQIPKDGRSHHVQVHVRDDNDSLIVAEAVLKGGDTFRFTFQAYNPKTVGIYDNHHFVRSLPIGLLNRNAMRKQLKVTTRQRTDKMTASNPLAELYRPILYRVPSNPLAELYRPMVVYDALTRTELVQNLKGGKETLKKKMPRGTR